MKKKKKVTRCKKCSERIEDYGVGFTNGFSLKCGYFHKDVTPTDGCTFGSEGPSRYKLCRGEDVILNEHAVVMGDFKFEED